MTLTERLENLARQRHEDDVEAGRRITFDVCRFCGYAKWRSASAPGEGFGVEVSVDPHECERCAEVMRRAPEVFRWVVGVWAHQTMIKTEEGRRP